MTAILQESLFYVFSALAILFAVLVIIMNNPVKCALALVMVFFASAGLWLITEKEFLALILVLVYVGAVMTLFLFVVMMINVEIESMKKHFIMYAPVGLFVLALLVGLTMKVLPTEWLFVTAKGADQSLNNTEALGQVLYTDYVLAFEIAAVVLLVAIISAIALAHRALARGKRQNILKQLMTQESDRLRVVKMPSATQQD